MEAATSLIENNLVLIVGLLGVIGVGLLFLAGVILLRLKKMAVKSQVFFEGKNGQNLEELILKQKEDIQSLDEDIQALFDISNQVNVLAQKSIHRVGMVRFNPFKDIGGDQSFSLALLDGKNSGVILSSLHTREGTRIYIKPVQKGVAEKYPFTEEEVKAVKAAGVVNNNQEK